MLLVVQPQWCVVWHALCGVAEPTIWQEVVAPYQMYSPSFCWVWKLDMLYAAEMAWQ